MIRQCYYWLRERDDRLFVRFNQASRSAALVWLLRLCTHLGSAAFTISFTLSVALVAPQPWSRFGWASFAALAASHLLAAVVKKKLQRRRPYAAIAHTNVAIKRLPDFSFPSGHTTAAFSIVTPFLFAAHWAVYVGLPLAAAVGLSRVCLGVHYPSDCLAGCLIGSAVALLVVQAM